MRYSRRIFRQKLKMLLRVVDYKALMYFFGIMLLVTPVLADPWDKAVPVAHGLCQYFKTQVILPCLVMVEDGVRYLLIHKDGKPIEYLRNNEDGTQTTVWEEGKES